MACRLWRIVCIQCVGSVCHTYTLNMPIPMSILYVETYVIVCTSLSTLCIPLICNILGYCPVQTPSYASSTTEWFIVFSYILYMLHMVFALRDALKISSIVVFFPSLPSSIGMIVCQRLFTSLDYHCGRSLAAILGAQVCPLCCLRQQWNWAGCFISVHIKASTHWKHLKSVILFRTDWKGPLSFGRWKSFTPDLYPWFPRTSQSKLLLMLDGFYFSFRLLISWIASSLGCWCININWLNMNNLRRSMNVKCSVLVIHSSLTNFLALWLSVAWTPHSHLII